MESPIYFLIISTRETQTIIEKSGFRHTCVSLNFLNNFLGERTGRILNLHKSLCINVEKFFCLGGS